MLFNMKKMRVVWRRDKDLQGFSQGEIKGGGGGGGGGGLTEYICFQNTLLCIFG